MQGATRAFIADVRGASPTAPLRIDGSPPANQSAAAIDFALDDDSLALRGDLDTDGVEELYRVQLAPILGAPVKMSGPMVSGGDVSFAPGDVAFADDGALIYRADQSIDGVFEIFRVDAPGTAARIHAPLSATADTIFFLTR